MTLQNPVSGNDTGLTPLQRCLDLIGQMDRDQLERFLATVADKGPNDTPQKAPSPGQTFQQAREILEDALVDLSGLVGTLDYLMVDIGTISKQNVIEAGALGFAPGQQVV